MCPNLLFQRRVIGALVVVVLFALLQAESATAAEILEEIIVTADFRGRSASELPGAITLLDSEAIEQAAVQHF
jgi:hypothetical protein